MRLFNVSVRPRTKPLPRTGSESEDPSPVVSHETVERPCRPRRVHAHGRWLSFAITPDSVEMAAARRSGRKTKLIEIRKIYTTANLVTRESRVDFICHTIEDFINEFGGRRPRVSLVINGPETALRTLELPALSGSKLASAVMFEARKRLPFPIHDCYYDYRVIARMKRAGKEYVRVQLLAATRRLVDEHLEYFSRLGLRVSQTYVAYDAIGQLLPALPEYRPDSNFALINVERTGTHISYYRGADLEFYHIASLGSSSLAGRTDEGRFRDFADLLAREIQNSLDYYTGQYATHFTNRVYVYGDLAYTDELVQLLRDQFGFEFLVFPNENLRNVHFDANRASSSPAVCLQTAAASACPVLLPNLLPSRQLTVLRARLQHRLALAALVVLSVSLGATSWLQYRNIGRQELRSAQIQTEVTAFERSDMFSSYHIAKQLVATNRSYIDKIHQEPSYLGLNFKELSRLTPEGVLLRQLEYSPTNSGRDLVLMGVVSSPDMPPELILAEYVERLNNSPWYVDVTVDRHVKRAAKETFELEFTLSMRGLS